MLRQSADGLCVFDSSNNSYWLGSKRLRGVTSYIAKHKQPQDFDKIASAYARKHNLLKEDVLAQWAEKSLKSRENGTKVHDMIERWFYTGEIVKPEGKETVAANFINDFFLSKRLTPVECEMVVYNEKLGLASMIDMIAKNPEGDYFILDWKTNESIKYESYNRFMLEPYQALPDADYYHYSLQVALYENMCKEYLIKESFLVHIGEENYNIIKPSKVWL